MIKLDAREQAILDEMMENLLRHEAAHPKPPRKTGPHMTDQPSREEVKALIAQAWAEEDGELATTLTSLLALAFVPGTEKTWEAAFEQGELSGGLSWADFSVRGNEKSINELFSLLARLSEVEKALEKAEQAAHVPIHKQGDLEFCRASTNLAHAFIQEARATLHPKEPQR